MDVLPLLRMLGALGLVLGLLAGALWIVRRYDIRLPGRIAGSGGRRLDLIERVAIDTRRSVALIRRDGREHLLLVGPEGTTLIESGIVRDEIDRAAGAERAEERRLQQEASAAAAAATAAEIEAMRRKAREAAAAAASNAAARLGDMRQSFATLVEKADERLRPIAETGVARAGTLIEAIRKGQPVAAPEPPPAPEPVPASNSVPQRPKRAPRKQKAETVS